MTPCTHPGIKRLFCLQAKNGLIMKRLFCLKAKNGVITCREVNKARCGLILAAGRVRSKKKKIDKKNGKTIRPTENTPRNPKQPGDRVQLKTACDETRPTR